MLHLVAATRNDAKLAALRRLGGDAVVVRPLPHDISLEDELARWALAEVEEGRSVEDIAAAKAVWWSRQLPSDLVIASDGGLEIPGLGDTWDPTRTRRFAGKDASDLDRARALLARAAHLQGSDRRIAWRESVAVARDGEVIGQWSAESRPGLLADDVDPASVESGRGFWVEAIWTCPDLSRRRLASLTHEERVRCGDHWSQLESPLRQFLATIGENKD